jgi:hypothetical protein
MEKDQLKDDREAFAAASDAESAQRKASQDDLEFALLEKQWDERDKEQRADEGRPCLTINRLAAFGKQVTNDGKLNRASIDVKPLGDGATKDTADIQSDLIRNIETSSQADQAYDTALEFSVFGGFGYFRINVDYACDDSWDQDIGVGRINNPFSVYGDPDGKEATSIDWNSAFVTDWMSKSAFEAKYGTDKKATSFDSGGSDYDENWFQDKRIRIAERWIRDEVPAKLLKLSNGMVTYEDRLMQPQDEGGTLLDFFKAQGIEVVGDRMTRTYRVRQRLITGTDVLEENDWLGKYIPIVPMYGEEVNINGKRHFISLVRRAKDPQRMYNYHRTQMAEYLSLGTKAPWLVAAGQVENYADQWAVANRKNLPYLMYDVVDGAPPPVRLPFTGIPMGDMQAALGDNDDMKAVLGMYDASLGNRSNETSGRAILARQREGDTSTFNFIDNRNKSVEHGGRIILDLIPHYYTVGRILRCIQEDGTTYTVPVGTPFAPKAELTAIQQQAQAMQSRPPMPQGMPAPPMPMGQPQGPQNGPPEYVPVPENEAAALPPELQQKLKAISRIFDPTVGKYDVTVSAGPNFNTRREESAQQMMEFIRIFPQAAPLIGDLLAKNLDWPGSEQVAERLKAMLPPQAQSQVHPIVMQLQQMLQAQGQQAQQALAKAAQEINTLKMQLQDKRADNALKFKELTIKDKEVGVKDREVSLKAAEAGANAQEQMIAAQTNADVTRFQQIEVPAVQLGAMQEQNAALAQTLAVTAQQIATIGQQQAEQSQALASSVMGAVLALQSVAAGIQQKPVKKVAKAVKQKDGTFVMESIEMPVEPEAPEGAGE